MLSELHCLPVVCEQHIHSIQNPVDVYLHNVDRLTEVSCNHSQQVWAACCDIIAAI